MNKFIKFSAVVAGFTMVIGFSGNAQAAGPYSCTNSTYSGSYATCSTNNTANQASTVATATTVLKVASSQAASLVSNRISSALSGNSANFDVAANGFSASTGISAGDMDGKAGVWVSGSWTDVEDDNADTRFDGNAYTGMVGADYQVSPKVVLGVSVGFEEIDLDTQYNGFGSQDGNLDGSGYTIAPYVGVKISDTMSADLTVGYSDLEYDTLRFDPNTGNRITGATDAERYFINAAVSGVHNLQGNWRAKVRGSVFYATEEKDAYTETESNSATIAVAEEETDLGQFALDTRLGYMYQQVEPYAMVGLEYDFTKDNGVVAAGQTESQDSDFGVKLGGGINLNLAPNVTGGIEAYTVEARDDYSEYAVTGGLRVNF